MGKNKHLFLQYPLADSEIDFKKTLAFTDISPISQILYLNLLQNNEMKSSSVNNVIVLSMITMIYHYSMLTWVSWCFLVQPAKVEVIIGQNSL